MSSTNKLYSRLRTYIAKFLLSFCGIASFGVAGMAVPVSATSNSNTVGANISSSIAIRLLDSTASTDITRLDFNFTPTASGSSNTQRAVVDVATSNPTGYKLYMQSNYQDSSSNYTTDLVHTTNSVPDADIADTIPTSTSASTLYWNYTNPMTSSTTVIPAHGSPHKLAQSFNATNSDQTNVDINVSVDTTIVSGTYQNQLLFSAVGNPEPVSYTVSFDGDGGTPVPSTITGSATSSTFSTAIDSTVPVKTGYTFSHWQITSVSSTSPTPDLTPTAVCNASSSNSATSSSNNSNTCNPGDVLTVDALGEEGVAVELTAVYTLNYHTVTITNSTGIDSTTITCTTNGTSSSANTTNSCDYGSTVTISATPSTGYSFDSWTTTSGGVTPVSPTSATTTFTMPDEAVAITASGIKMYNYTFQFDGNAGSETVTGLPALQNHPQQTLSSYTITIPSGTPVRSGYTFTGYNTKQDGSGTTYQPGNTITASSSSAGSTPDADGYPVTTVLYAQWSKKSYTVTFSKSNISAPSAASTTIGYGDTITVSVTPASGYYLSTASCSPSGSSSYTCSGVSTGTSQTGTQTMTIKNNNYDGNLTVTLTGTLANPTSCAAATPVEPGDAPTTVNMPIINGTTYVKLYTKSNKSTSACYTKDSQGSAQSKANAAKLCPDGSSLPTRAQLYANLTNAYGTGGNLYTATGWDGEYFTNSTYSCGSTEMPLSCTRTVKVTSSSVTQSGAWIFISEPYPGTICQTT